MEDIRLVVWIHYFSPTILANILKMFYMFIMVLIHLYIMEIYPVIFLKDKLFRIEQSLIQRNNLYRIRTPDLWYDTESSAFDVPT